MDDFFDICILGGGINGCGIANDAASRGLKVLLIDKDDFASHTSSNSSKLIHGGLRYLERGHFSLVKKALNERSILLKIAPQLVFPQAFIIPDSPFSKSPTLMRIGLWMYDNLSFKNTLPSSRRISARSNPTYFSPLSKNTKKGFVFYDTRTNDARLVLANALSAKANGAILLNYAKVTQFSAHNQCWQLTIQHQNIQFNYEAKCIINATGPFANLTNDFFNIPNDEILKLVKGSHLVIKKLYEGDHGYFLHLSDKRIVFIIPYNGLTLIGTTEESFTGDLDNVFISENEKQYLYDVVQTHFNVTISDNDIIDTWSGVRPLINKPESEMTDLNRDYQFHLSNNSPPYFTIYGGKLTTYRRLADDILESCRGIFPSLPKSTTSHYPLYGNLLGKDNYLKQIDCIKKQYAYLPSRLLSRYIHTYGLQFTAFCPPDNNIKSLGKEIDTDLFEAEINYLVKNEWAKTPDDIIKRRIGVPINQLPFDINAKLLAYL
jgi:glycerol-3-phosphate dehydrogenase